MSACIKESKTFFSFEFFPPRTDEVVQLANRASPCTRVCKSCIAYIWLQLSWHLKPDRDVSTHRTVTQLSVACARAVALPLSLVQV